MDKMFGEGIKKFVLMGIGAAAMTVEKSQQMVDELVKKGELTVESSPSNRARSSIRNLSATSKRRLTRRQRRKKPWRRRRKPVLKRRSL